MSPLERDRPLAGPSRHLELQIRAMFRCCYNNESRRSVAIDLFGGETKRKNIADGIEYLQGLFEAPSVDARELKSSPKSTRYDA